MEQENRIFDFLLERKTLITPDRRRTKTRRGDGSKSTRFRKFCIRQFQFWNL